MNVEWSTEQEDGQDGDGFTETDQFYNFSWNFYKKGRGEEHLTQGGILLNY